MVARQAHSFLVGTYQWIKLNYFQHCRGYKSGKVCPRKRGGLVEMPTAPIFIRCVARVELGKGRLVEKGKQLTEFAALQYHLTSREIKACKEYP